MVDHQGGLGERTVRRPDHSGEVAQTDRVDLQHGPHADGPHGGQGPAHRGENPQPDPLPLGGDARTGSAQRAALRAQKRVQRRADADDAVPPGNRRTERQRTRRIGNVDQREKEKGRKEMIHSLNHLGANFANFALPMLVQSSLLIVLLFALDLVLRNRVRAVVRYGLWMLLLIKLVLPPSFAAPTSLAYWLSEKKAVKTPPAPSRQFVVRYSDVKFD